MILAVLSGAAIVLTCGILVARLLLHWRRLTWLSALGLLLIAGIAATEVWVLVGARWRLSGPTVFVLTEPVTTANKEVRRALQAFDASSAMLICVDRSSAGGQSQWRRPSDLENDNALAEWLSKPASALDPQLALEAAERALAQRSKFTKIFDFDWLGRPRIVVLIGDRERWKEWQPVHVKSLLDQYRRRQIQVDLMEIASGPSSANIEISSDLDLPADKPLGELNAQLRVRLLSPQFTAFTPPTVGLRVSGGLYGGQAVLAPHTIEAHKVPEGGVEFILPLSKFVLAPGEQKSLSPGFAPCELTIESIDPPLTASGRTYLRVRRSHVIIVCGKGDPNAPLRQISPMDVSAAAPPQTAEEIRATLDPLLRKRGGPIATYECMSAPDFAKLLAEQRPLPMLAVLHELSPDEWPPAFCKDLNAAVGLHLLIVDPPVRSALADPVQLDSLLPAYARADPLHTAGVPATIDRTACLTLVFDYNRLGRPRTRQNSVVQDGLNLQYRLAHAAIEKYRAGGVLFGELQILEAADPPKSRVVYLSDPRDRICVRVAPKLTLPIGNDKSALGNLIVPSAMELRLATVFADLAGIDRSQLGLASAVAGDSLAERWSQAPAALPNHTVLIFVHRRAPQPRAGDVQPPGSGWSYALNDDESSLLTPQKNADGMLANLAVRGVEVAVVGLALGQDDGPRLEQGVVEMAQDASQWPKDELPPLSTFALQPNEVLEAKRENEVDQLTALGAVVSKTEAIAALVRSPGASMFGELDLMDAGAPGRAEDLGRSLADRWLPLHRAPRESMAITLRSLNRAIDERIAPVVPYPLMLNWQADPSLAGTQFPVASRWAAPQRIRVLEANPRCLTSGISTCVYGVSPAAAGWKPAPLPLTMNANVHAGQVFVMAYSPIERGPESIAWDVQDQIFGASRLLADRHGPDRLIQLSQFLSRLRPLPLRQPQIIDVTWQDVRNGLFITAEFLPAHTADPSFFAPAVQVTGGVGPLQHLSIVDIDAGVGRVTYELAAPAAASLCRGRQQSVDIQFLAGQPRTTLRLLPPAPHELAQVSALDSVHTLAGLTGGGSAPMGIAPAARFVSVRFRMVLLLVGLILLMASSRACSRLTWITDRRKREAERRRLTEFDAIGSSESILQGVSLDTTSKPNPTEQVDVRRIRAGDDPHSLIRNDLVLAASGLASRLGVRLRTLQRTPRVLIVVQAGRSMRLFRTGNEPKLQLAGYAAELIAHVAFGCGAEVSLAIRGLRGEWECGEVSPASANSGDLAASIAALAGTKQGALQDLQSLDVVSGTCVVYISDWLEESLDESIFDWAQTVMADGGQFAGIGVCSTTEFCRAGWGWTPRMVCDRVAWTYEDHRAAYDEHFREVCTRVELASGSIAVLHTDMDEQGIAAAIERAELLSRILQV